VTTPAIVQSAFVRGNTSPQTLTLGSAPAAGNWLLFIQTGFNQALTPPAGLTLVESDLGASATYQSSQIWARQVQSGDGTSWAFTGESDWHNLAVFELSGVLSILGPAHGACTGSGSTSVSTGALAASPDSNALRLLVMEWDNPVGVSAAPTGFTLLSPSTWQATGSTYHDAGIWQIPATTSGAQAFTMSAAANYPIWLDIVVSAVIEPSARVTQTGTEVWVTGSQPPLHVTQLGAEVWVTGSQPPLRVTQIGAEVWVDISTAYAPPAVTGAQMPIVCVIT
jgi:hypothetical protein